MKRLFFLALTICAIAGSAFAQVGTLAPGDLQLDSGEYIDLHYLTVEEPSRLVASLTSDEFDPYLAILDAADNGVLEVDDSDGYGFQVHETLELTEPGVYTVAVTSAFPGETGSYQLSLVLEPLAPAAPPAGPLGKGAFNLPDLAAPEPTPAAPTGTTARPESRIAARPGFITGTVFDTQGNPLAGANVLVTGTTFDQGQRTQFETVTGADGTYSLRVPDGRYAAKAWIDVEYGGHLFSRLLHPLSGPPSFQVDSTLGGNLDFQWRISGLTAYSVPPGREGSDFYGASIDFSYCGLPADAYCTVTDNGVPTTPIAPGGSRIDVVLTPTGPLIDGSAGEVIRYQFVMQEQDPDYPYGSGEIPGYPNGGGGRLVLGTDWEYHGFTLLDIPLGNYRMSATVTLADGSTQPLRLGLSDDDVNYGSVPIIFQPWEDYSARSYIGGGITELDVYVRD